MVKNPPAYAGDTDSIPGSGRSLEEKLATHSSILAWKPHGQRGLAGYSPWVCKRVRHDQATAKQQQTSMLHRTMFCYSSKQRSISTAEKPLNHHLWEFQKMYFTYAVSNILCKIWSNLGCKSLLHHFLKSKSAEKLFMSECPENLRRGKSSYPIKWKRAPIVWNSLSYESTK